MCCRSLIPEVEGREVVLKTFKDRGDKNDRWLAVVHYVAEDRTWHDLNDEFLAAGLAVPARY